MSATPRAYAPTHQPYPLDPPSTAARTLSDPWLLARSAQALVLANVRYWCTVAPNVRRELRRWERRAQAIPDPALRALAMAKLNAERFNAEAAAMFATLAPRAHRKEATVAIVALELLFDYLDGLTERPSSDPLREGERTFAAFTGAIAPGALREDHRDSQRDGGYLHALSDAAAGALAQLPASAAVTDAALRSAKRGAQAQIRMHAAPHIGTAQLEDWARGQAPGTGLQWREFLAGSASSVLAVHALIAAAADARTTPEEAAEIEAAYLSVCVLLTLLDGLVDHELDARAGVRGYIDLYEDRADVLSQTLTDIARRAVSQTRELRNGAHHTMTLAGVIAYCTSAPGADGELARPVCALLHSELSPLISPTLALMHTWRLARRVLSSRNGAGVHVGAEG